MDNNLISISPQFTVHVIDPQQLLLLSEQRSFRLKGKLYVALLPYLNGTRTVAQIYEAFEKRAPRELIHKALTNLLEKKFAIYVAQHLPVATQAIWVELGLEPLEVEKNLKQASFSVSSLTDSHASVASAHALTEALKNNGLSVVNAAQAEVLILSVDDYLNPELAARNLELRAQGRSWMLFKGAGTQPVWGPLFRPDSQSCWACFSAYMLENRPGDRLLAGQDQSSRPAKAYSPGSIQFAASLAALDVARTFAQGDALALQSHVFSFNLANRLHETHLVRTNAACPVCGVAYDGESVLRKAMAPLVLKPLAVSSLVDGGWRVRSAAEVVSKLERYVSPLTGVISGLEDKSLSEGLPVFAARQMSPVHISPQANRSIGKPSGAMGKGMSPAQAKASCLAEAIERYLCGYTGREPRRLARWRELGDAAPHPYTYLNYSEQQFNDREVWNQTNTGFNWVGERFDEEQQIDWTPAWSLTHHALRWLPTRFCYFNYGGESKNEFCRSDSNGCASGSTLEEAVLQGFFELIERDACALWWYNRLRVPQFNIETLDDPFQRKLQAYSHTIKRGLHVLDLTTDLGIPVAMAISYRLEDGGGIYFGLGSHLDVKIAISRALSELNQLLAFENETRPISQETIEQAQGDDVTMLSWLKYQTLETASYCAAEGVSDIASYHAPVMHDLRQAIEHCTRIVSEHGFDMIVLDLTREEIEFSAARVVIPGLRHFWARFRQGRLYSVPVDLGYLEQPKAENELNPIPFFL